MSWKATAYAKTLDSVTRSEKLVCLIIADYYNDEQQAAWPSVPRLAREARMSERQARRVIHALEAKGILRVVRRPPAPSFYRFPALSGDPDTMSPHPTPDPDILHPDPDTVSPPTLTPCPGDPDIAMSGVTTNEPENMNHLEEHPRARAGVYSRHTLEDCRSYAEWMRSTGQGIKNPEGFAVSCYKTGFADKRIDDFLRAQAEQIKQPALFPVCKECGASSPCSNDWIECALVKQPEDFEAQNSAREPLMV